MNMRRLLGAIIITATGVPASWYLAGARPRAQVDATTAGTWTSIGPAPLAYERAPNNAQSGRISSIAVDPTNPSRWLVGVGNGGVWESRTAGAQWQPLTDSAPTLAIGAVAFAPSDPSIIYVGTGESAGVSFTKTGLGILKSIDGGASWALLGASSLTHATVKRLRVHPTLADVLVVATARGGHGRDSTELPPPVPPPFGILKSVDGGVTWDRRLVGQATALEIDTRTFERQYAAIADQRHGVNVLTRDTPGAVTNGVYRSVDGGNTWARVEGPWGTVESATESTVGRIELAMSPSNPDVLYAGIQVPPNRGPNATGLLGLFRTDDAWAETPSWVRISTDATGPGGYCGPTKCGYSHVLSVDPLDPHTVYAGGAGQGFWRCARCGAAPEWTNVTPNTTGVHSDHHAVAWAGNRLLDGNDGGIWSSVDRGRSWQNHNPALPTSMFFKGALHPTNTDFILAGFRDFKTVYRREGRWLIADPAGDRTVGEADVAISSSRPDTDWMLAWLWGTIQRTTDGGRSVIAADAGIDRAGAAFVAPVRKCPSNDNVFVTGTNRLWRSDDFFSSVAPSWRQNSAPDPFPSPNAVTAPGTVFSIAFAAADVTCDTYAYGNRGGRIQVTRDGGATWIDLDPGRTLPARPVNGLAFAHDNPNILFAVLSSYDGATPNRPGHVFKTSDALAAQPTWSNVSPPGWDVPFNVVAVDPRNAELVYAGTDLGLWRSLDGAATWIKVNAGDGIPNVPVYDIQINPSTARTVVFTYGRGAFELQTAPATATR